MAILRPMLIPIGIIPFMLLLLTSPGVLGPPFCRVMGSNEVFPFMGVDINADGWFIAPLWRL